MRDIDAGQPGDPDIPGVSSAEPWRWTQARTLEQLQRAVQNYARSTELTIEMVARMREKLENALAADLVAETEALLAAGLTASDPTLSAIDQDEAWLSVPLDQNASSEPLATELRIGVKSAALTLAGAVATLNSMFVHPYANWAGFEPLIDELSHLATATVHELQSIQTDADLAAVWESDRPINQLSDRLVDFVDVMAGHVERSA